MKFARAPHIEVSGDGERFVSEPVAQLNRGKIGDGYESELRDIEKHIPVCERSWRGDVDKQSAAFKSATELISWFQEIPHGSLCGSSNAFLFGPAARTKDMLATTIGVLSAECTRLLASQPMVVCTHGPTKVFGDIHGQLSDLLALFRAHGFPSNQKGGDIESVSYVFNGDFVDRGPHQLECVVLLFSLKVAFPDRVFLIRGNHEFRLQQTEPDGFYAACTSNPAISNGERVWEEVNQAFDMLPFAARIGDVVLVVHGGIAGRKKAKSSKAKEPNSDLPKKPWTIKWLQKRGKLRPLKDFTTLSPEEAEILKNIVWSDPITANLRNPNWRPHYLPNSARNGDKGGIIHRFSHEVTKEFCKKNDLRLVIRSHECCDTGYEVLHDGYLCTVFSARDYCGRDVNDAALALLVPDQDGCWQLKFKTLGSLGRTQEPAQSPPHIGDQGLVDSSKVYLKNDPHGRAGAFAACDIRKGEVVEYGIVRVLTNVDGNVNPCVPYRMHQLRRCSRPARSIARYRCVFKWSDEVPNTAWAIGSGARSCFASHQRSETPVERTRRALSGAGCSTFYTAASSGSGNTRMQRIYAENRCLRLLRVEPQASMLLSIGPSRFVITATNGINKHDELFHDAYESKSLRQPGAENSI